tara:strand:+ start:347 stop:550 length:204 start_codon:yes stop_codon:yes gene_type:complete
MVELTIREHTGEHQPVNSAFGMFSYFLPAFQALLAQREFLTKHGEPKQLGCLRTLYHWHAPPHTFPG